MAKKAEEKSWKDRLGYVVPKGEESAVGIDNDGEPIMQKFFPIRVSTAFMLKDIAKPIVSALTVFFANVGSRETSTVQRTNHSPYSTPAAHMVDQEVIVQAVDKNTMEMKIDKRVDALNKVLDTVCDAKSQEVIALLIQDSMREVFPVGDRPPLIEFFNELDPILLTQMLAGVWKANKDVFGPLADGVREAFIQALSSSPQMNKLLQRTALKAETNATTQAAAAVASTPGSTSKTQSHGSSSEATNAATS